MAKQQRKHQIVKSDQGQGQMVEEIFDDNLLPDASEIEKLYKIDPTVLEWLKNTAEREQRFRHSAFDKKHQLVDKSERGDRLINILGLIFSFIIILVGMGFSAFLILNGNTTIGSIFAGGTLIGVISGFLSKVTKQSKK